MTVTETTSLDNLTLSITQEIHIRSSPNATFAALLDQMGPANETPDGKPLPMKIEPWPGGRWYRDLGGDNGHFSGHVQAIKEANAARNLWPVSGARVHTASRERGGAWKLMKGNRE